MNPNNPEEWMKWLGTASHQPEIIHPAVAPLIQAAQQVLLCTRLSEIREDKRMEPDHGVLYRVYRNGEHCMVSDAELVKLGLL
jgi:hypothetical protein